MFSKRPTNSATTDRFCDKLENDFWGNSLWFSERKFTEVNECWAKRPRGHSSHWVPEQSGVTIYSGFEVYERKEKKIIMRQCDFSRQQPKLKILFFTEFHKINKRIRFFLMSNYTC